MLEYFKLTFFLIGVAYLTQKKGGGKEVLITKVLFSFHESRTR